MDKTNKPKPEPALDGPNPPQEPPMVIHAQLPAGDGDDIVFEEVSDTVNVIIRLETANWMHAGAFGNAFMEYLRKGFVTFIVDCSRCKHMDEAFLAALATGAIELSKRSLGAKPELIGVSPKLRTELEESGLQKIFNDTGQDVSTPGRAD